MILQELHILNYKNIREADLTFADKLNCFVGINGPGKTNLLDAIYYMSFCKSFFLTPDSQNIHHDEPFFVVQGGYVRNEIEEQIYCGVKRGQKKQFKRNKKDYQRIADHIGLLPLVIIAPFDELLIADGSEERRKYMDSVISQCDKTYLDVLLKYNKLLQQRNALLKQMQDLENPDLSLLDVFDMQMAQLGSFISQKRADFVAELKPILADYYQKISSGREIVEMNYVTGLQRYDLYEGLKEARNRDIALGYTSRGIHKDDVEFTLDTYPIRRVGSQGQRKSFVIALKLSQFQYLTKLNGFKPILLLDDVFDKLDSVRGDNLISLVANDQFSQIFITDTNRERLMRVLGQIGKEYKMFNVDNGVVNCE
ncbi:MAG: DNA replication/repair protein RecF [Bacteroidales bacterium]|nr:DNA replication/repair protein RecF [Bacteroidales bacterium]